MSIFRTTTIIKNISNNINCATTDKLYKSVKNDVFIPKILFHFLKKKLRTYDEIVNFLKNLSDENRYIGNLPKKWVKLFDKSKIGVKTQEIQKIFSNFARSEYTPYSFKVKINSENMEKLAKDLEKALGKKCSITFVGRGLSGKVFGIKCAEEDVVLKTFYSNTPNYLLSLNGKTKEIANAVALNYTLKPNKRAKFYFGKVAIGNESDGFMVSEFVDKNKEKPGIKDFFKNIYNRFECRDSQAEGNIINGKIVDFGYIKYKFVNTIQQKMAKKLCTLIEKGNIDEINKMKRKYSHNIFFKDLLSMYKHDIERIMSS